MTDWPPPPWPTLLSWGYRSETPKSEEDTLATTTAARPLYQIAREILADWPKPNYGAVPYLDAMLALNRVTDPYGADDGEYIVAYFLANATTWRGETARRVKAELKALLKSTR